MHKAQIRLSQARGLCTAAELRLVESSRRQAIAELTGAQLKKNIAQARQLRDKWRNASTQQRRPVQRVQRTRVSEKDVRSQQKSRLFGEVLVRLEAQLERFAASPPDDDRSKRSASSGPAKRRRGRGHRPARSLATQRLAEQRAVLESHGAQPEPSPPGVVSQAVPAQATEAPLPAHQTKTKTAKKSKWPAQAVLTRTHIGPDHYGQPGATAAAKRSRIKVSGMDSRMRGHVSARGKRSQASRDAKN